MHVMILFLELQKFPFKHSQSKQRHIKQQYTTFWVILPMNNLYMILMIQLNFLCKNDSSKKRKKQWESFLPVKYTKITTNEFGIDFLVLKI